MGIVSLCLAQSTYGELDPLVRILFVEMCRGQVLCLKLVGCESNLLHKHLNSGEISHFNKVTITHTRPEREGNSCRGRYTPT